MNKLMTSVIVFSVCAWFSGTASAQETVECISHHYEYNECYAPLDNPQLVYQESHSACIINRTWGFNPKTSRIWVNEGCSGVFADASGYHHGRSKSFDSGARTYGPRGHDTGAVVAGVLAAALIEGAAQSSNKKYTTSNAYHHTHESNSGYTGCHGVGCLVDNPDQGDQAIDNRPQFDKEGNPNFDTKGNYQGCHGVGCDVDDPDSDSSGADDDDPA